MYPIYLARESLKSSNFYFKGDYSVFFSLAASVTYP